MSENTQLKLGLSAVLAGATLLATTHANAFSFEFGELEGGVDTLLSAGAAIRTQRRSPGLVAKTNIEGQQAICDSGDPIAPGVPDPIGGCILAAGSHDALVAAQGSYSINGDNGNLNYDQHDITYSVFKVTSDFSLKFRNFGMFARGLAIYDPTNDGFRDTHPNNFDNGGFQFARTDRSDSVEQHLGFDANILDVYAYADFGIFDRTLTLRYGRQVISFGESLTLVLGSLNTINPPNATRLRTPGFDFKELFIPLKMGIASIDITESLSAEAFYVDEFRAVNPDPVGSFNSSSDVGGVGGRYAMLGLGRSREDPENLADDGGIGAPSNGDPSNAGRGCLVDSPLDPNAPRDYDNPADNHPGADRGGTSGRAACIVDPDEPSAHGQYGIALKYFSEALNDTEFGFYFMNYHSRLPYAQFIPPESNPVDEGNPLGAGAGAALGALGALAGALPIDPSVVGALPSVVGALGVVDQLKLRLTYPEDIRLYGFSFNTTAGDLSISGEYAYRENQPLALHAVDATFFSLGSAFGQNLARFAAPNFIAGALNDGYLVNGKDGTGQGRPDDPSRALGVFNSFIRRPVGNGNLTFIAQSAQNPFGADKWLKVLETGFTNVFNMPDKPKASFTLNASGQVTDITLSGLPLDGPGTDTSAVPGRFEIDNAAEAQGNSREPLARSDVNGAVLQNPERQTDGFADGFSWGFRFINILTYNNLFFGMNVSPLFLFFYDVNGTSPGPGGNFIEGRKTFITGANFEKGSWLTEVRYAWLTGAREFNLESDRDSFSLAIKYQF